MTQEPRPTPEEIEIESVLHGLRNGCDGFRDYGDHCQRVDEFRIDCLMEDAAKVIEHLQQSQAKSLTPEQVERARKIIKLVDRFIANRCNLMNHELESAQLLREVVGDVL